MVIWTLPPWVAAFLKPRVPVGVSVYMWEPPVMTLTFIADGGAMVWQYPDAGSAWIETVRGQAWPV